MNQSLYQLAKSYEDSIKNIEDIVAKTREELAEAKRKKDRDACEKLHYKLAVCYEEIRDMKLTAETLKGYYEYNEDEYAYAGVAV